MAKNYLMFLLSLLVALIALSFLLKVGKKLPIVGGVATKAGQLADIN